MNELLRDLVILAGAGQLLLAAASLAIPRVLGWREETARLRLLTRQVFWTYAGYIWTTNVFFGIVSVLAPRWLLDHSPPAALLTGYIAAYWGARLVLQLFCFDRSEAPAGFRYRLAEAGLLLLFVYLTLVYAAATVWNVRLPATA